ncbi:MAG: hypothetical protein H6730_05435 [Deltaproteobacteria bacterium]|nr:hypothetical protein [Deltaproteobacteria bacterium]
MNAKILAPALGIALGLCFVPSAWAQQPEKETNCSDRIDEDGDTVTDCADADCYDDPVCKTAGGLENNNVLCSDWIDNDGDGAVDCEDVDCNGPGITACQGSWQGPLTGTGATPAPGTGPADGATSSGELPVLGEGQSVEDLLGTGSDADGERNDFVCSDGFDNDGDGAIDCADFGCRFDPNVSVCRGTPGLRFSVAVHAQVSYNFAAENNPDELEAGEVLEQPWDTRVNRLQLRAFGPIPYIQDSFFLISIRAEANPRLTFAFFNMPLGGGHYVNINSGGGSLSNLPVLSVSKNPMLDGAYYLTNAFEQGNGAAAEVGGPLVPGLLDYRVFAAGGSGRFNGNIGGRFFNTAERNYTWGIGAQLALYVFGRFDRWDTRFLYTTASRALTVYLGGRYDQREFERYPWANLSVLFRWGRLLASLEANYKREINFKTNQVAGNLLIGFLIIDKLLYLSADVGGFTASDFQNVADLPNPIPSDLSRLTDQFQWRVALTGYVWRNQGLLTLLYTDSYTESFSADNDATRRRELRLEAQMRF